MIEQEETVILLAQDCSNIVDPILVFQAQYPHLKAYPDLHTINEGAIHEGIMKMVSSWSHLDNLLGIICL